MKHLPQSTPFLVGAALVLVMDAALLGQAAWNRTGRPTAELQLTEREAAMPAFRDTEDTGLFLSLILGHQTPQFTRWVSNARRFTIPYQEIRWLDRSRLAELGFDTRLGPSDGRAELFYASEIPRSVFVVLELEGEAWRQWLAGEEERLATLRDEAARGSLDPAILADEEALLRINRIMRSRLFAIDAGADAASLRERYPDRHRYAVVEGTIRPKIAKGPDGSPHLTGEIGGLASERLNVSRALRSSLEKFLPRQTAEEFFARPVEERRVWPAPLGPRYRGTVAFGRRLEPWLVRVESLEPGEPEEQANESSPASGLR